MVTPAPVARLVGRTDFCDYPAAALGKPSVGGMVNPNLETLVALRPDLVVATDEGNRDDTIQQLTRLRIQCTSLEKPTHGFLSGR